MKNDRRGVIGMPIRLAVVFMILALTVPVMVGFVGDFRKNTEISDLTVQAETVSDTAKKTYYAGVGGVFTADVSVGFDCELIIGGESYNAYEIKMVRSGEEVGKVIMDRPPVRIPEPVHVTGTHTLKFECVYHEGGTAVKVGFL